MQFTADVGDAVLARVLFGVSFGVVVGVVVVDFRLNGAVIIDNISELFCKMYAVA